MLGGFWLIVVLSLVLAWLAGRARREGYTGVMWALLFCCAALWGVGAAVILAELGVI